MTIVKVPENRKWIQPNTSVLYGNIYSTYNVDFSLPGFIKLAPRTRYIGREESSVATFKYTQSIIYMSPGDLFGTKKYYFLTDDKVYTADTDLTNFADIGIASDPTTTANSDAVASGLYYVVSTATEISYTTGGVWVNNVITSLGGAALTTGVPHPMCYGFDLNIMIGNRNKISRLTPFSSYTADVITLPISYCVQWIRSIGNSYWIGTRNYIGGKAIVCEWDAFSSSVNQIYEVDSPWAYSGVDYNGTLHILTADGRLMIFNGAGFTELSRLPPYTDKLIDNNYNWGNSYTSGSVHQNGMQVIDGLIHVLLNSEAYDESGTPDATQKFSSGIWVYDPEVGFYHKYGLSNSSAATDFGQPALQSANGAIAPISEDPTSSTRPTASVGGTLLYGARLKAATATNYYVAGSVTTGDNRGNFTSARIESPEMQESWRDVFIKYEEFENDSDAIVVKYKTKDREDVPFTTGSPVTWSSTTVFTSTDTQFANAVAGDEVTILSGTYAGATAHISDISYSAPTYTVTLDEAITGISASDTAQIAVDNYHKLSPTITTVTAASDVPNVNPRYAQIPIPLNRTTDYQAAPSEWIQLKIEMRDENIRISELKVLSETQTAVII